MRKYWKISEHVYECSNGGFYVRPTMNGKRTWRALHSIRPKEAILEGGRVMADHASSEAGLAKSPFKTSTTLGNLIEVYLQQNCPNAKLEARDAAFVKVQTYRLARPKEYFGHVNAEDVTANDVVKYADWLRPRVRCGTGNRTVDLEMAALSGVFRWAKSANLVIFNPVRERPRYQTKKDVRHCREVAMADGDELHRVVGAFFDDPRSEVLGWQALLEAFTGCRTSEILRLRMDATRPEVPGFVDGSHLYLERCKKGTNPFSSLHPALRSAIDAHHHWHAQRYPKSPWWFPGRTGAEPVDKGSLCHGLARVCRELGIQHRTSHGLRSYYVTARRGQGVVEWQIASELGLTSVELINSTYGDRPANYQGGNRHTWLPSKGAPAWARWLPDGQVVFLPGDAQGAAAEKVQA